MRASLGLLLLLWGCGPAVSVTPEKGPAFGHFEVVVKGDALEGLAEPLSAKVGGIAAYDVARVDARTVRLTVQGHPEGGKQPIVVSGHGVAAEAGELEYTAPKDARLKRVVAFGASLTMGSQDASVSRHSQLAGPAALIAKQMGAYLGVPLMKPGYMPAVQVSDYDPASLRAEERRRVRQPRHRGAERAVAEADRRRRQRAAVAAARRPRRWWRPTWRSAASASPRWWATRPTPRHGAGARGVGPACARGSDLVDPPRATQLDRVAALQPTLLFATDLIVNDYNNVDLGTDGIPDLAGVTSEADIRAALEQVLDTARRDRSRRCSSPPAPTPPLLPQYDDKIAALEAKGFSESDATGWRDPAVAEGRPAQPDSPRGGGVAPEGARGGHGRQVAEVLARGVDVGGRPPHHPALGGLLSLDSMHFSDTGYALLANGFIDAINQGWG